MSAIKNAIKSLIKKIILIWPDGYGILARAILFRRKLIAKSQNIGVEPQTPVNNPVDRKGLFTDYYRNNYWGDPESVSGAGSTLEYTENIRKEIPKLLEKYKIKSFLDAPCGDYNWIQAMERPQGMEYIGGDIVEELVKQNQAKYGNDHTRFLTLDIVNDALPTADMWLCRDCLFHFSYDDIYKTLTNFIRSDIKYLITGVHPGCVANADIPTGSARQFNLELPPFNFCKPLIYIDDWIPGFTVRRMALWTKPMVVDALALNPEILKKAVNSTKR